MRTIPQVLFWNLPIQQCPHCGHLTESIRIMNRHGFCPVCSPVTDNALKNALFMRRSKVQKRKARLPMPVTDNRVCEACKREFRSTRKDAKFCSPRCRQVAARKRALEVTRKETQSLLANL